MFIKRTNFNNKIYQIKSNDLKSNDFQFDHFAQNSKFLKFLKLISWHIF